jgi:diamine N-acetyltransferase
MVSSFHVRRAVAADADKLTPFALKLFHDTYADDTPDSDLTAYLAKSFSVERQKQEILDPRGAVFLGMTEAVESALAGYAHMQFPAQDGACPFLNRLYVARAHWGSGLSTHLLNEVVAECQSMKANRLQLTVFEKNVRAIAFYKRSGFALTGSTTFAVGNDIQLDVAMELSF